MDEEKFKEQDNGNPLNDHYKSIMDILAGFSVPEFWQKSCENFITNNCSTCTKFNGVDASGKRTLIRCGFSDPKLVTPHSHFHRNNSKRYKACPEFSLRSEHISIALDKGFGVDASGKPFEIEILDIRNDRSNAPLKYYLEDLF